MKKTLALAVTAAFLATPAFAADVKIGVLLGFTGPIESLTPDMASGAELAMKEASESGAFMGGSKIISVRGDSTCVDAAAATATAERLDHRRWCQCHYGCRLFRCDHSSFAKCCACKRRGYDFTISDLTGSFYCRRQWTIFPDFAIRCASRSGASGNPQRERV